LRQRKLTIQQTRNLLRRVPFNTLLGMRIEEVHGDGITIACALRDNLRTAPEWRMEEWRRRWRTRRLELPFSGILAGDGGLRPWK
jgi:hypothetical protein